MGMMGFVQEPRTSGAVEIMAALKSATWELHEQAEHHPYQRAFVKGLLSREAYTDYLGQMLIVHRSLESHLAPLQETPIGREVLRPYHFRAESIGEDLAFLGVDSAAADPGPSIATLQHTMMESVKHEPVAALGFHYVLEGSTNGSKFIARSVQRALGLSGRDGTAYLNPHADLQTERWTAFKQAMNHQSFTERQTRSLIDAAETMFRGVIRLSDDLLARIEGLGRQTAHVGVSPGAALGAV